MILPITKYLDCIFNRGGLEAFNVILLSTVECNKNELSIYREIYKTNVEVYINISK